MLPPRQVTGDAEQIVTVFGQLQQGLTAGGEVGATDAQSGQVRNMYRNMTTAYRERCAGVETTSVRPARPSSAARGGGAYVPPAMRGGAARPRPGARASPRRLREPSSPRRQVSRCQRMPVARS